MSLSTEQKIAVAKAYEPVLIFHPEEKFTPVNPKTYMESCAMWCTEPGQGSAIHRKENWGDCTGQEEFPRRPLIPKPKLSTNPDDEGSSDKTYIGEEDEFGQPQYLISEDELLWLDTVGWADTEEVTETSQNLEVNIERAVEQYEGWKRETESGSASAIDWYSAEVTELSGLGEVLVRGGLEGDSLLESLLESLGWETIVVWYYFLYPVKETTLRDCERIAGVGRHGNYEGDWTAVGVVVPLEDGEEIDPNDDEMPSPKYIAYGRQGKGVLETLDVDILKRTFRPRMEVYPWRSAQKVPDTQHPLVWVSRDSHNNYWNDGEKSLWGDVSESACEATVAVDEKIEELEDKIEEAGEIADDIRDAIVALAKIGGGALIGGPAGALVGGIAALVEALTNDADFTRDTGGSSGDGEEGSNNELEPDLTARKDDMGVVLASEQLIIEIENTWTAQEVRPWTGQFEDRIVDRNTQLWWPTGVQNDDDDLIQGYDGRWGALCQEDPYDSRSGIEFPLFRRAFLLDLAYNLAEE